jgi:hypothetical protein
MVIRGDVMSHLEKNKVINNVPVITFRELFFGGW